MPECQICGIGAVAPIGKIPGYIEDTTFEVFACSECASQSVFPRTVPAKLYESIYQHGAELGGYSRYFRYADLVEHARNPLRRLARSEDVYWGVESLLKENGLQSPIARVIEVGSGLGYLVAALRASGYDAAGLDISALAVAEAKRRFGDWFATQDISNWAAEDENGADTLIALELIEHVESPLDVVKEFLNGLKPGGDLILSTPNRSYYLDSTIWSSDLPPVHLHWISEAGMCELAKRNNCTIQFVDFTKFNKQARFARPRTTVPIDPRPRLSKNYLPINPQALALQDRILLSSIGTYAAVINRRFRPKVSPLLGEAANARSKCMVVRITKS